MKKVSLFVLSLLVLLLASCSMDSEVKDQLGYDVLTVTSDVDLISGGDINSRSITGDLIVGDPIVGVLLNMNDGSFEGIPENVFYIQYLGDGESEFNGDEMEYNYILHCPRIIYDVYDEAGSGGAYTTGRAFWWYMRTYFSKTSEEINNDWYVALTLLIEKRSDELPLPDIKDCIVISSTEPDMEIELPSLPLDIAENEMVIFNYAEDIPEYINGLCNTAYADRFFKNVEGYDEMKAKAFYISKNYNLYCPSVLDDVYAEYIESAGIELDKDPEPAGDSFWKYMSTYFNISFGGVKEQGFQIVYDALLTAEKLPYPQAIDYSN